MKKNNHARQPSTTKSTTAGATKSTTKNTTHGNNYHKEFAETFGIQEKDNWYKLTEEQEQFYLNKGCLERAIKCPKGSMVFWDSRTIHCGIEPTKNREQQNTRCVVYLCYMPRELSNQTQIKKKMKAFESLNLQMVSS